MTEIGGKPVYTPITPVDNNAKPSSAPTQGGVGHGNLPPGPNVTWVKGVVKKDAETMAKRAAFTEANGAMGDRTQYLTNQLADARSQTRISQGAPQVQQEEGSAGPSRSSDIIEGVQESSKKSLDAEAKHAEEVAQSKQEALQKMLEEDRQRAQTPPIEVA